MIGQLLQNVSGNALTFRGELRPALRIGAARQGKFWRFSVEDNGIGIAPAYGERIFQVCQRPHGRARYPGAGIGLAQCKQIVARHGGQIGVASQPCAGATAHADAQGQNAP